MKPKTLMIVVGLFVIGLLLAGFGLSQPELETEVAQAAATPTATPTATVAAERVQRAEELLEQGIENIETENYEQAVEDLSEVIALAPDNAEAYYQRGVAYGSLENLEQALTDLDKAIELDPDYAEAYLLRGYAYADYGNNEQAISDLEYYLELVPDVPSREAITNAVELMIVQGWLVTAEDLNALSGDIGITNWKLDEELPGQARVCRMFAGESWSVNPNYAMNCVNELISGSTFADIVDSLYDQQILRPTDIALEPSFDYSGRFALYAQGGEGPPFYDAFLVGDETLFRASVSVGLPVGYTPETLFEERGDVIEVLLNKLLLINLGRSGQSEILDDADAYFAQGNAFYEIGDYERAIAGFTGAIKLAPEDTEAYQSRGTTYYHLAEYDQAVADYTTAIQLVPDNAAAYNNRGKVYTDQGDIEQAVADFGHALQLRPDYAEAYNNRGILYFNLGDYEQAIIDYDKAIELQHDPLSWPYNNRANAYRKLGNFEQALADYTTAIELQPDFAQAYAGRGHAHTDLGNFEQAVTDCTKAIELQPNFAGFYNNRGFSYYYQGDFTQAIADFDQAIQLQPDNAGAYLNRGVALFDQGDTEAAIADYKKAIELEHDPLCTPYNNLGNAYRQLGDFEQAIVCFTTAIDLQPDFSPAYYNRGLAYVQSGDTTAAIPDLETALALGLPPPMKSNAEEVLTNLKSSQTDCKFIGLEPVPDASIPTFNIEFHGPPGQNALIAIFPANAGEDAKGDVTVTVVPGDGIVAGQIDYSSNEGQSFPENFEVTIAFPGCKTSQIISWP